MVTFEVTGAEDIVAILSVVLVDNIMVQFVSESVHSYYSMVKTTLN